MTDIQTAECKPFREQTAPLLKPRQVEDMKEEQKGLETALSSPAHISGRIQDKPAMFRQLNNIKQTLERDMPREYATHELDLAKSREAELISQIRQGMPTQEEMRRNPPGAVDKHRTWEARNKDAILEWKNIRKRLHASGAIDDSLPDSTDLSNIEMYRPSGGSQQMNMDNAQITGKEFHMDHIPSSVIFSEGEIATLKLLDPELAKALCTMPAEARSAIKAIIKSYVDAEPTAKAEPAAKTEAGGASDVAPEDKPDPETSNPVEPTDEDIPTLGNRELE